MTNELRPSHATQIVLPVVSGMREVDFSINVRQGAIVVSSRAPRFEAVYFKLNKQLILAHRTDPEDHELLDKSWQAAHTKARDLGWIV